MTVAFRSSALIYRDKKIALRKDVELVKVDDILRISTVMFRICIAWRMHYLA